MNYTKSLTAFALAVLAIGGIACGGGGGGGADGGQVTEGRKLFNRTCAVCHGPGGQGSPRLGKSLIDNAFSQDLSDAELVEFLREGRSAGDPLNERGVDMPPKGGNPALTDADLASIVAYLRSL